MKKNSAVQRIVSSSVLLPGGAAIALGAVVLLQALAIDRQSLIGDAPYHLVAGEQALRYGQNRLNLEHPPLVKLVAAIALLDGAPVSPPETVNRAIATSLRIFDDPARMNRVRHRSRWLLFVVFAAPMLCGCYALGRRLGGPAAGLVLVLAMGLSFQVLPFLSVIQTDTAVTLGFVLTLLAAIRYVERPSVPAALLLGAGLGVALAAKFSGVLAAPVVLATALLTPARSLPRRGRDLLLAGLGALAVVYVTYAIANRDYDPEVGRDAIRRYCRGEAMLVDERMLPYQETLLAVESVAPNLAQWLTGFLGIRIQNEIGVYASYAFGKIDSRGRLWYFPALLLVKTSFVLLLATALALAARFRDKERFVSRSPPVLVLLAAAVGPYLVIAFVSSYNLGVRHLMPVLPVLFLPAALWAGARRRRSFVVGGALLVESLVLAPLWMSATNTWWLGAKNPTRFSLSAADSDYRQNFLILNDVARERGIERLHVLYPLVSDKEIGAYVRDAVTVQPGMDLEPGWYAVNVRLEQYLPALFRAREDEVYQYRSLLRLAETWDPVWRAVAAGEDHGYVAGTFHLYHLPP